MCSGIGYSASRLGFDRHAGAAPPVSAVQIEILLPGNMALEQLKWANFATLPSLPYTCGCMRLAPIYWPQPREWTHAQLALIRVSPTLQYSSPVNRLCRDK